MHPTGHPCGDAAERAERSTALDETLTRKLTADYDALQNDLEQARELALGYQAQLARKTNDFAGLKLVLEKATHDLAALQAAVVDLRKERHRLANEAFKTEGLREELRQAAHERDRFQRELILSKEASKDAERRARTKVVERERLQKDFDTLAYALECSEKACQDLTRERAELREELVRCRQALEASEATVREFWRNETTGEETAKPPAVPPKARGIIKLSYEAEGAEDLSVFPTPRRPS